MNQRKCYRDNYTDNLPDMYFLRSIYIYDYIDDYIDDYIGEINCLNDLL